VAREAKINMLPSKGQPNLDAAARLMVPLVLDAIHQTDALKNAKKRICKKNSKTTTAYTDQPEAKES